MVTRGRPDPPTTPPPSKVPTGKGAVVDEPRRGNGNDFRALDRTAHRLREQRDTARRWAVNLEQQLADVDRSIRQVHHPRTWDALRNDCPHGFGREDHEESCFETVTTCAGCGPAWPCSTIQAYETALAPTDEKAATR